MPDVARYPSSSENGPKLLRLFKWFWLQTDRLATAADRDSHFLGSTLDDDEKKWVQAAADEVNRLEPTHALELEHQSMAKLEKTGVKFVKDVDKSGFLKIAEPIQDKTAAALGPHAVEILTLVPEVK